MVEKEDTVSFEIEMPISTFRKLEQLRSQLNEPTGVFYPDVLMKGGAVKEVDQVYNQVVGIIDDESDRLITLFEFMDGEPLDNASSYEGQKTLPLKSIEH
jgi:hypothetical protein